MSVHRRAGRRPPDVDRHPWAPRRRAQLDVLFETANRGKIMVVNSRQLFPSAALRNNVAGGIPRRQLAQNLTVVFADHRSQQLPLAFAAFQLRPTSYLCSSLKAVGVEFHTEVMHLQRDGELLTFSSGGLCAPFGPAPYRSRTRRACGPV